MTTTPLIQIATADDIPALAALRAVTWGTPDFWTPRIKAYMDGTHSPQHARQERVVFVADDGAGLIAGHLTERFGCTGELQWIDVHPDRRGTGLARALVRRLAEWFSERCEGRICVNVAPENAIARRFYARCGATELSEHWLVWKSPADTLRYTSAAE